MPPEFGIRSSEFEEDGRNESLDSLSIPNPGPHTGAILVGGRSLRMGAPKEAVRLRDGRPMIDHVIEPLAAVCRQVVMVGGRRGSRHEEGGQFRRVPDNFPGQGPLAGIEALLSSGLDSGYLVVACDQPFLTAEFLRKLLVGDPSTLCLFRAEERAEINPFPGYYPAGWLPMVRGALEDGERSVHRVIERSPVSWVSISSTDLARMRSVNTPAELAQLRP